jgi:hypothetical protein
MVLTRANMRISWEDHEYTWQLEVYIFFDAYFHELDFLLAKLIPQSMF